MIATSLEEANPLVRWNATNGFDLLDSDGNVRTTFDSDDLIAASPPSRWVIVHSDDGLGWSSTPLNDLTVAKPVNVVWIATLGDATTLALDDIQFNMIAPTPLSDLHVLIGTPQR